MRLAFMGTPSFSVPALKALLEHGSHEVLFVVTQPDRPQGRGMHVRSTPVKDFALARGLQVFQPESLKGNDGLRDIIARSDLDAVVVVAYGKMIPADWLDIPRHGFINVHASLLPELRGASPINRAILEGKKVTGISIMLINEAMDAGPVFLQASTPIGEEEDALSLSERLSALGAQKLVEALPLIENGSLHPVPQDHTRATYAPMLRKEEGEIDWNASGERICTMVRGLVPWPCAYTYLDAKMVRILRATFEPSQNPEKPGTLIRERHGVRIACRDGYILPGVLQLEGRRAVGCEAFSCGLRLERCHLGGRRSS